MTTIKYILKQNIYKRIYRRVFMLVIFHYMADGFPSIISQIIPHTVVKVTSESSSTWTMWSPLQSKKSSENIPRNKKSGKRGLQTTRWRPLFSYVLAATQNISQYHISYTRAPSSFSKNLMLLIVAVRTLRLTNSEVHSGGRGRY